MSPSNNAFPFGFRIFGSCRNDRRLIDWPSAFVAYCDCDQRAEIDKESYLSAFCFGDDFKQHLTNTGSTKGYAGATWSPWLWFDIDASDLNVAVDDARKLAMSLVERYNIAGDELLIFFSGSKGFHIGLPTSLWNAEPSANYHTCCRRLAELIADWAGVTIDKGVYDKVRAFRAPNSQHPKTGRYKRVLRLDELLKLGSLGVTGLAANPEPFELPNYPGPNRQAVADWEAAAKTVEQQKTIALINDDRPKGDSLNRATLEFIREGATTGDRHRVLFSAAANLAEFGCTFSLAWALLSEPALDSGLPPNEVRRQIECGLSHRGQQ